MLTLTLTVCTLSACIPDKQAYCGHRESVLTQDGYDEGYTKGYEDAAEDYEDALDALEGRLASVESRLAAVETLAEGSGIADLAEYLSVDTATDSVIFSGANVYIQDGSGDTAGATNSLGNLIIGYSEQGSASYGRNGSHNLVVGAEHEWTSYGGVVAGYRNTITGVSASILGGDYNIASGTYAAIAGGEGNNSTGRATAVAGGAYNEASGSAASVAGGNSNRATAEVGTVGGGWGNTASFTSSHVSGGRNNEAAHNASVVVGGNGVTTTAEDDVAF
jgi:hypothetical protein